MGVDTTSYENLQQKSLIALFQLYLVMVYVLLDFSYGYWVFHWHFKLPAPLNNSVPMALLGLGNRLKEGFSTAPKLAKQAAPS